MSHDTTPLVDDNAVPHNLAARLQRIVEGVIAAPQRFPSDLVEDLTVALEQRVRILLEAAYATGYGDGVG